MRGAWIEISTGTQSTISTVSPPMRGAWIEILFQWKQDAEDTVAPHAGGVD